LSDDDDWELLGKSAKGDAEAFGTLASRHYRPAVAFCRRVLGDHHGAEDVVQRGLLNVYRRRDRLEPRASFRTFLYRALLNLCLNEIARRKPVSAGEVDETDATDDAPVAPFARSCDPQSAIARRELREAIDAAVAKLGPKHRAALYLRDYEELSYGRIAEVLEASLSEVKIWIHRGRKRVAAMMGPYLERGEMPS
jgi:RNA polymerase sigma-70 factor, ECF subfamily